MFCCPFEQCCLSPNQGNGTPGRGTKNERPDSRVYPATWFRANALLARGGWSLGIISLSLVGRLENFLHSALDKEKARKGDDSPDCRTLIQYPRNRYFQAKTL